MDDFGVHGGGVHGDVHSLRLRALLLQGGGGWRSRRRAPRDYGGILLIEGFVVDVEVDGEGEDVVSEGSRELSRGETGGRGRGGERGIKGRSR